jgi:hypothetical protein
MSLAEVVVEGTLKPDGTLELDQKPSLSPGRVQVVLRPAPDSGAQEDWWPLMQRVRAEREASGYPFMNEAAMQTHLNWLRDDDDRIDRIYREMEQQRRQEKPS